jgi:hypothetical protein
MSNKLHISVDLGLTSAFDTLSKEGKTENQEEKDTDHAQDGILHL